MNKAIYATRISMIKNQEAFMKYYMKVRKNIHEAPWLGNLNLCV